MSDARKKAKALSLEQYRHRLGLLAYSEIVPKLEVDALLAHDAAQRAEIKRLRALLAERGAAGAVDFNSLPVHFVTLLPRGRVFMHPDTWRSPVRDPWPPPMPEISAPVTPARDAKGCE